MWHSSLYSRVLPLFGRNEFIESKSGSSRSAKTCLFFFISNTVFSLRIIFVDLRDLSIVLKEPDFWLFVTMLLVTLLDSWSDTWRGVGHIWPQLFDRFLKPWMSSLSKSSLLQDYTVKLILFIHYCIYTRPLFEVFTTKPVLYRNNPFLL